MPPFHTNSNSHFPNSNASPESDSSNSSSTIASERLGDSGTLEKGLPNEIVSDEIMRNGREEIIRGDSSTVNEMDGEGQRKASGGNAVDISTLSVQGSNGLDSHHQSTTTSAGSSTSATVESNAGTNKVRRASSVSTGSSGSATTDYTNEMNHQMNGPVDGGYREEDILPGGWGGKGIRDSKPARRKAARMGSFEVASSNTPLPLRERTAHEEERIQIDSTASSSTLPPSTVEPEHVDIVSYPSGDLIKLIAILLEQIAGANDLQNQQAALVHAANGSSIPGGNGAIVEGASGMNGKTVEDSSEGLERGRFDAAPLNSPVTPLTVPTRASPPATSTLEEEIATGVDSLPVTPGVDLLRQVSSSGLENKNGFIPSLGGAHAPMPLSRRRGSSFLTSEPPLTSLLTASALALASPSATLCFHARNIPAIGIEAYLLRILKYCPTTNEVFLALLVYFDRMARVGLEAQRVVREGGAEEKVPRLFAIDSFNVHRLVIAGVTVASKFFSDVFYTNSRYAKVGGLPLVELNQLELQFLLLNDFRLVVPVDELQRYADQLILFWVGRNSTSQPFSEPLTTSTLKTSTLNTDSNQIPSSPPHSGNYEASKTPLMNGNSNRPEVERTPSSAGTSIATITPSGTPTTPRAASEGELEEDRMEE